MASLENIARQVLGVKPITDVTQSPVLEGKEPQKVPEQTIDNTVIKELQENIKELKADLKTLQERFDMDEAFEELED